MTKIQENALLEGTQIAVYEIKEVLGGNQSEIIYRAWNGHLNGMVILKEYFPCEYAFREKGTQAVRATSLENTSILEFGLGNFIQQNEKLLEIQHPGAQTVHNVLEFNQTAYLAVDEQKGSLLSEFLDNSESYSEEELKTLLGSLLGTLEKFHEAGVVHGDIHPGNILIKKNGNPVLLNFASARQRFSRLINNPASELRIGYGSPEQYLVGGSTEPSSDLYALGATLYRCISGSDPEDARNRISDLNESKPDPLKSILDQTDSAFSGEFLVTVDWMMQADSKTRPQSVSEISPALSKDTSEFKYIAASPSSQSKALLIEPEFKNSKSRRFSTTTLVASVLASAVLGSAATWYVKKIEAFHDPVVSGQQGQEGIAFGKAIDEPQVKAANDKVVPPSAEEGIDANPSTEKVSGIIAAIEGLAVSEPALGEQVARDNEPLVKNQKESAGEPVVAEGLKNKDTTEAVEKNTNIQVVTPSASSASPQGAEQPVEELEATLEGELQGTDAVALSKLQAETSIEQESATVEQENNIETGYQDGLKQQNNTNAEQNGVESKGPTLATSARIEPVQEGSNQKGEVTFSETTSSEGNANVPLPDNSAEALANAPEVGAISDNTSLSEIEPLTEGQVISEESKKEVDEFIANENEALKDTGNNVDAPQAIDEDEKVATLQEANTAVASTSAQDSENSGEVKEIETIAAVESKADGAPLPELLTDLSAENINVQESLSEEPTEQVGLEDQANNVAGDRQAESFNQAESQAELPNSETTSAQKKIPTPQGDEQTVANANSSLPVNSIEAQGAGLSAEANPATVSLSNPSSEAGLLNENIDSSEPSESSQIVPDETGKGVDIFVSNSENTSNKSQSERTLIEQYMAKAKENIAAFQLTTPAENNAHYYYKLVLEIDPQHKEAQKGSEEIFDKYVVLINKAIKNNETDIAKIYLDRAKTILPDSSSHQEVIEYLSESLVTKPKG